MAQHKLSVLLHFITLVFPSTIVSASASTTTTTTTVAATGKLNRLVTKLIHQDSIFSPYYNPHSTISDRAKKMIKGSISRFAYIGARTESYSYSLDDIRGGLIPASNDHLFVVNVSIGEPPVPQLVAMDTGSALLWIQCLPCTACFEQSSPMYDPSKSSTYSQLPCDHFHCRYIANACDSTKYCPYNIAYLDNTFSKGNLATEKLTLVTSDEGTTSIPDVTFGCGHNNSDFSDGKWSGIFGLGQSDLSVVSQLGSKFSYCLGNITDHQYSYNQLIIGQGAKIEGYSTPIEIYNGHYYLTLLGIRVGDKLLDINSKIFEQTPSGKGGVIIDSGAALTSLPIEGYEPLKMEVQRVIGDQLQRKEYNDQPDLLCYRGVLNRDLKGFPVVTFQFAEEADLVLDIDNMFFVNDFEVFCMAAIVRGDTNQTIIGIMAQQYYNFAYDLDAMKIYFQRIDCELLED